MLIPTELQQAIDHAHAEMLRHPHHELLPFFRRGIYSILQSVGGNLTHEVRLRLDVMTAKWVLPTWQKERPNDLWPQRLISVAEGVLQENVSKEEARVIADAEWQQWEDLGTNGSEGYRDISNRAFAVQSAAIEALFAASGRYRFDSVLITNRDRDTDLDAWSSDAALYGSSAYAGAVWDLDSDSHRRKEFWEWWLLEAIPEAWEMAYIESSPAI